MTAISINETESFSALGVDQEMLRICIGKHLLTADALDVLYQNIRRGWTTAQNADSALAALVDAWRDGRGGFKQHRRDNAKARRSPVAALLDERAVRRQRDPLASTNC